MYYKKIFCVLGALTILFSAFSVAGAMTEQEVMDLVNFTSKKIASDASGTFKKIIGAEASNLITELGLAIEMGATLEDIALTIHAHPTLGEISMEAAEVALGQPIHSM